MGWGHVWLSVSPRDISMPPVHGHTVPTRPEWGLGWGHTWLFFSLYSPAKEMPQDIQNTVDPNPKQVVSGGTSFSAVTQGDACFQHRPVGAGAGSSVPGLVETAVLGDVAFSAAASSPPASQILLICVCVGDDREGTKQCFPL